MSESIVVEQPVVVNDEIILNEGDEITISRNVDESTSEDSEMQESVEEQTEETDESLEEESSASESFKERLRRIQSQK